MVMKKIMNMMVNSCNKTTELIDKQQLVALSGKEKLQLQLHKSLCSTCNAYEQQSKIIEKIMGKWFGAQTDSIVTLTAERKIKIMEAINR